MCVPKPYCHSCWGKLPKELAIKGRDRKRRHSICHQLRYDIMVCSVCKKEINEITDSYKKDCITGVICHQKCHSPLFMYSMVA
jgi:hypothetical protein